MKKIFTALFSILLYSNICFGQTITMEPESKLSEYKTRVGPSASTGPFDCQPDTILRYEFSSPNDSTLTQFNLLFYYNESAIVDYFYTNNPVQLQEIDSTVYDGNKRVIFDEKKRYDFIGDSTYIARQEWNYYFENTNLIDSSILYATNFGETQIEPRQRSVLIRNNDGILLTAEYFDWDDVIKVWTKDDKEDFFNNSDGLPDYSIEYIWDGDNYVSIDSNAYFYNSNQDRSLQLIYNPGEDTPKRKVEYVYDYDENTSESNLFEWDTSAEEWIPLNSIFFDFDEYNNIEASYFYFHDFESGSRNETFYPLGSECRNRRDRFGSSDGINWEFTDRYYYLPEIFLSSYTEKLELETLIYPNPTSDGIWIEAPQNSFFEMYTMQGQLIEKGKLNGKEFVPLEVQSSTHLVLKIHKDGAYTSRIIQVIK